nr:MAG TPA: hypothetical protein [Caudoviricetes sp.]
MSVSSPYPSLTLVRGWYDWHSDAVITLSIGRSNRWLYVPLSGIEKSTFARVPLFHRRPSFAHPLSDWLPRSLGGLLFYIVCPTRAFNSYRQHSPPHVARENRKQMGVK